MVGFAGPERRRKNNSVPPICLGDAYYTTLSTIDGWLGRDFVMKQADLIRTHLVREYIDPARADHATDITIRAGDVHREMHLSNAMPAVCSALGGRKFAELADLSLLERRGPKNGANVYFRFTLLPSDYAKRPAPPAVPPARPSARHSSVRVPRPQPTSVIDLTEALVLVSCVKSKQPHDAPARELYTSAWFTKVRTIVEAKDSDWYILSATHGLVSPSDVIAPYERTLNTLGVKERKDWAARVLDHMEPKVRKYSRVVFFAGMRYREFLIEPLQRLSLTIEVPMEGLSIGRQLAWLNSVK